MKDTEFNTVIKNTLTSCEQVLCRKATEYVRGGDRLHNFRRAGKMLGCSPERALVGMKVKHDISVLDMVNDIEEGILPSIELLDEKIGDSIIYLLLLKAAISHRLQENIATKNKDEKEVENLRPACRVQEETGTGKCPVEWENRET